MSALPRSKHDSTGSARISQLVRGSARVTARPGMSLLERTVPGMPDRSPEGSGFLGAPVLGRAVWTAGQPGPMLQSRRFLTASGSIFAPTPGAGNPSPATSPRREPLAIATPLIQKQRPIDTPAARRGPSTDASGCAESIRSTWLRHELAGMTTSSGRKSTMAQNPKNEKQYEALKDKGMSKERATKIANTPSASKKGGKSSGSGRSATSPNRAARARRRRRWPQGWAGNGEKV